MNSSDLLQALRDLLTPEQLAAIFRDADERDRLTLREVVEAYLRDGTDDLVDYVRADRENSLRKFMADLGGLRVADCTAAVMRNWVNSHPAWRSRDTKASHLANVRRALNWALENRLIREFPFRGLKLPRAKFKRRGMPDEDYRLLMRLSPAAFRRFLVFLRLTGCRPSEAAALRWSNIDFDRGVALLREHKTVKHTGEARAIILPPTVVKLLRWMKAQPENVRSAEWLQQALAKGPRRVRDIAKAARQAGLSYRMVWKAAKRIGASIRKIGVWPPGRDNGYRIYELTAGPPETEASDPDALIFKNQNGDRWNKNAWSLAIRRARKRSGKAIASAYCLRHRLATELCRAGVNLKIVAAILGHRSINTTIRYTAGIADDLPLLQSALGRLPT